MTPSNITKLKNDAQTRYISVPLAVRSAETEAEEESYIVEGYATTFDRYVLWDATDEKEKIYEQFSRDCFTDTDMSDIIFQFDHNGRVFARTGNDTLKVTINDKGIKVVADLGKTEGARELYAEIKAGMINKMSWRFAVGKCTYDEDTQTLVHKSVRKIYDVSAVSIPANDNTEINARSFADGVIAEAARSDAELNLKRKKIKMKIELLEVTQ